MADRSFAFLFTDIEGSTRLWDHSPEAMTLSLQQHDRLVRGAIEAAGGNVFKTVGDAFCAVFSSAECATRAAADIVVGLRAASWDERTGQLKVRVGVHVGSAHERDGDYFGATLNRTARLMSAGHGDQVLLSQSCVESLLAAQSSDGSFIAARSGVVDLGQSSVAALGQSAVVDLGEHRLKDLTGAERIYQLAGPDLPAQFPDVRTLDVRRTNLPVARNTLLGRERELRAAGEFLRDKPLLSVIGSGGIGKTRFALQLCAEASDDFPDGVWFVDLSSIESDIFVASTVARVLGVTERVGEPLLATIADYARDKRILVLLDNCEHVLDRTAQLVATVTAIAPGVRFVATTRDVLAIGVEQLFRLDPLPVPSDTGPPEAALASPSVRLFIERARAVRPDIDVGVGPLQTIAEICRRLDGIPLAIELGAARTALLDVAEIPRRMDDLLRLLAQKRRDVAPRQQTLEALVDWSYRLLGERDRTTFQRLAVFAGRFAGEAATRVCAWGTLAEFDVEDALESLVQKSFVVIDGTGTKRRLRLFETIRQFAESRLAALADDARATADRHVDYFTAVAKAATDESSEDLTSFAIDLPNIRTAFHSACLRRESTPQAAELGLALGRYSLEIGAFAEGTAALEAAQALPGIDGQMRGWIDFILGQIAWRRERYGEARERYTDVQRANVRALTGRAEWGLAIVARTLGEPDEAKRLIGDSIAALEGLGPSFGLFQAYNELCGVELALGDSAAARAAAERALAVAHALGHERARATALGNLATLTFYAGDLDVAATLIDRALDATERVGARVSVTYFTCVRSEIALFRGNASAANDAHAALALAVESEWTELAARCAETLAALDGLAGNVARAAFSMAWAHDARLANGIALDGDDRAVLERKRILARWQPPERNEAISATARMPLVEFLEYVKRETAV